MPSLSDSILSELAAAGVVPAERSYARGRHLFRQGERPDAVLSIRAGLARTTVLAENGTESLIALSGPGETIGILEYFLEIGAVCSVAALESVSAAVVPYSVLAGLGAEARSVERLFGRILAEHLRENAERLSRRAAYPVEYNALVAVLSRLGVDRSLSKADLAEYLGVSARHADRVLARLSAEGAIRVDKGGVSAADEGIARRLAREYLRRS